MSNMDIFDKARMYLGDYYHLHQNLEWNKEKKELYTKSWKLFLKYNGYLEDGSEPIMTSETNTEKDLLKFAKENRFYQIDIVILKGNLFIAMCFFILTIINSFFRIKELRFFFYGGEFVLMTIGIVASIFLTKNSQSTRKYFERRREKIFNEMERLEKKWSKK